VPPSGVPHRVVSDAHGYYYIPLPAGAGGAEFHFDVALDTNPDLYRSLVFSERIPEGAHLERDLQVGLHAGGAGCDPLDDLDPGAAPVSYEDVQAVFSANCVSCHGGSDPNAGLRLTPGDSYDALVGVPSREVPGELLVEPGLVEASFLLEKVSCARPQAGVRMPVGSALDSEAQAVIFAWVAQGAPPSTAPGGRAAPGSLAGEVVVRPGDRDVPLVQLLLAGREGEAALIESVDLMASGSGDDARDITAVKLYADLDGDALVDDGEPLLARGAFRDDDGSATLVLEPAPALAPLAEARYLVACDVAGEEVAAGSAAARAGASVRAASAASVLRPLSVLAAVALAGVLGRRRSRAARAALLAGGVLLALWGCGDDGGGGGPEPAGGPQAGSTYAVSVTGLSGSGAETGEPAVFGGLPVGGATLRLER
jgi:hypothetical protein